nr:UvrD-helicase domain-containing protein [Angustibacter aerolatus]
MTTTSTVPAAASGTEGRPGAVEIARALGRPEPTPEQVAVIEAPVHPLLVVAGAGSGKTETMAARVVWLVAGGDVAPDEVLGLTFTRKAAGEPERADPQPAARPAPLRALGARYRRRRARTDRLERPGRRRAGRRRRPRRHGVDVPRLRRPAGPRARAAAGGGARGAVAHRGRLLAGSPARSWSGGGATWTPSR